MGGREDWKEMKEEKRLSGAYFAYAIFRGPETVAYAMALARAAKGREVILAVVCR